MIFDDQPERGTHWMAALTLSVALHGGGAAYALGWFQWPDTTVPRDMNFPQIEVTALNLEVPEITVSPDPDHEHPLLPPPDAPKTLVQDETTARVQPDSPAVGPPPLQSTALARDPFPTLGSDALHPASPITPDATTLTPQGPAPRALAPDGSPEGTVTASSNVMILTPSTATQSAVSDALVPSPAASRPPPDLALADLVARIRNRLADPCLVAIPRSQGPGTAPQLTVLSDNDRQIANFQQAIFEGTDISITLEQFLFDARQCPALEFARAQPEYPTYQLSMGITANVVPSGGVLSGTIRGTAGRYVSLLLIDANGVVQDLRRFLQFQAGRADFEVPVTLDGAARDTSQLLMALTTPARPDTITQRAGNYARDTFPQLRSELGNTAQIALIPFDVR